MVNLILAFSACPTREHRCNNANCVSNALWCDSNNECEDWKDEFNCSNFLPRVPYPFSVAIRRTYFYRKWLYIILCDLSTDAHYVSLLRYWCMVQYNVCRRLSSHCIPRAIYLSLFRKIYLFLIFHYYSLSECRITGSSNFFTKTANRI